MQKQHMVLNHLSKDWKWKHLKTPHETDTCLADTATDCSSILSLLLGTSSSKITADAAGLSDISEAEVDQSENSNEKEKSRLNNWVL